MSHLVTVMQKTRKTVRRMGAGLGPGLAQTQALDHDHSQAQGKDPKDPGEFLDLFRCVEPGMYLSSGQIGFGAKDISKNHPHILPSSLKHLSHRYQKRIIG